MAQATRALDRGLAVLASLEALEAASLAELARDTALSKATLLRLLATLIGRGWVYRRLNDGRYLLSATIGGPAGASVGWVRFTRAVLPILRQLSDDTGLPADLTVATGFGVLEVMESTRRRGGDRVDPWVVGFRPSLVFSSPGRAILAACAPEARARHIAVLMRADSPAEQYYVSSRALERELDATRARGYARREPGYWPKSSDLGEEPMDIALPVRLGQTPCASLSLVWPAGRHAPEDIAAQHLDALKRAAEAASAVEA